MSTVKPAQAKKRPFWVVSAGIALIRQADKILGRGLAKFELALFWRCIRSGLLPSTCMINPVKHALVRRAIDWPYSPFFRDVRAGIFPEDPAGDAPPR